MTTIDGEVVSVRDVPATVEPTQPVWLRLAAWLPSVLVVVIAVALVAGTRCSG